MKRSRLSEAQIMSLIQESEAGVSVSDLCRVANSTFDKLKAKYGGMEHSDLRRLQALEDENRRLKQMYADMRLEHPLF